MISTRPNAKNDSLFYRTKVHKLEELKHGGRFCNMFVRVLDDAILAPKRSLYIINCTFYCPRAKGATLYIDQYTGGTITQCTFNNISTIHGSFIENANSSKD